MALLLIAIAGCGPPKPRPEVYGICRSPAELEAEGTRLVEPHLRKAPGDDVPRWSGASLPVVPPDPRTYIKCRPCTCSDDGVLATWDAWHDINKAAYARLRTAEAPYPVGIVPGFHGRGVIANYRLSEALRLLELGWVGALILSGGYQRSGENEALWLYERAHRVAERRGIDVTDRLFVEPCACRSITNVRNSLRMMAAMGIPSGLFVTDGKMSGQAALFYLNLDKAVATDLGCVVGSAAHVTGPTPLPRFGADGHGCRAGFGLLSNPLTFLAPTHRLVLFWVSPAARLDDGSETTALSCTGGSERIRACEPDDQDPYTGSCLPVTSKGKHACDLP